MRSSRTKLLLTIALPIILVTATATRARATDAAALLARGIEAFDKASFDKARALLAKAAAAAGSDAKLAAKAELHIGLAWAIEGKSENARTAFERALGYDVSLDIDRSRYSGDVAKVFDTTRGKLRGTLVVTGAPAGAQIRVDGKQTGAASTQRIGRHRIEVISADGKHRVSANAVVRVDKSTEVAVKLPGAALTKRPDGDDAGDKPAKARGGRLWTWIALGTGVALAATSIGLFVHAGTLSSEEEDIIKNVLSPVGTYNPDTGTWSRRDSATLKQFIDANQARIDKHDEVRKFENISYVLTAVAGALGVAAVVLFFVEGSSASSDRDSKASFAPMIGPGVAGASLDMRF